MILKIKNNNENISVFLNPQKIKLINCSYRTKLLIDLSIDGEIINVFNEFEGHRKTESKFRWLFKKLESFFLNLENEDLNKTFFIDFVEGDFSHSAFEKEMLEKEVGT